MVRWLIAVVFEELVGDLKATFKKNGKRKIFKLKLRFDIDVVIDIVLIVL